MDQNDETNPVGKNPIIDPKDIVLHLRTIHFSLLVACVGLYILVSAGRPEEIDLARSQLSEIITVIDRWQPGWVENAALEVGNELPALESSADRAAGPIRLRIDQSWTLLPLPQGLLDLATPGTEIDPLDRDGPLWSALAEPKRRDAQFAPQRRTTFVPKIVPLQLPAPQTLRDFESFWNALGRVTLSLTAAGGIFPVTLGPRLGEFGVLPYGETPPAGDITVSLRLEPIADVEQEALWRDRVEHEWDPRYHFVGYFDLAADGVASLLENPSFAQSVSPQAFARPDFKRTQPASISMAAQVDTREFDAQAAFIRHFGLDWRAGSYALNFPELSAVAESNDDLYFDKVTAFIESKARQSEGEVAIFGFSVPAAMVSSWGVPIVLVAQLYFLLHLRSLRQSLMMGARSELAPWIGVYEDRFARGVAVASAFVLPPVTVVVVVAPEVTVRPVWSIGVMTSCLLGLVSFAILRKVWRELGYRR